MREDRMRHRCVAAAWIAASVWAAPASASARLSRPIRPHRHRVRCGVIGHHELGRASASSAEEKTNREERMGLRIWGGLLLVAAALAMNAGARAQTYPDRPVRILIAFPAGGTIDTLGRILAQKLTEV